jgi:hypothetical protein
MADDALRDRKRAQAVDTPLNAISLATDMPSRPFQCFVANQILSESIPSATVVCEFARDD